MHDSRAAKQIKVNDVQLIELSPLFDPSIDPKALPSPALTPR